MSESGGAIISVRRGDFIGIRTASACGRGPQVESTTLNRWPKMTRLTPRVPPRQGCELTGALSVSRSSDAAGSRYRSVSLERAELALSCGMGPSFGRKLGSKRC